MSEEHQNDEMAALIELHRGLVRKGPGDPTFTCDLLARLPALPPQPRIADLGCGAGAGALLLARYYQSHVKAVDSAPVFLGELQDAAVRAGLDHLIEPVCGDMACLDWPPATIDLLWSEGAAYAIGFAAALRLWRPLLAAGGVAVISEMTWFARDVPAPLRSFWQQAYPGMRTAQENVARAARAGYKVVFIEQLPSRAWWENYYGPLRERIRALDVTPDNRRLIAETEAEMALFESYSDFYGYTFYVLTP